MKNLLITTILMITSFVGIAQSLDTTNPNRFFPQRLEARGHRYFKEFPGKYKFELPNQRGPQLPMPDSIYMKTGKVVMIFDEQKIKQFIQNKRRKWMNL